MIPNEAILAIREAMSTALNSPDVSAKLPGPDTKALRPIFLKDEAKWTREEHAAVLQTFVWAAQHC